ncbi:helix-turn-helix domain-containing protein [Klugiella xanthotipulae]|uniref:IclR family transcriptional regulator n=1 Tax=Klugiella xanthotipulae TaxID=244735 RepID=UPI001FE78B88|nr:helix-turn-helix domain-containing protein [Klugiella xanthotipulae]
MADLTIPSGSGAQTLARGIVALKIIVNSAEGLSAQELGERIGVHRTIAHRILSTLADADLIAKGADGRYRGAVGLLSLTAGAYLTLRDAAIPVLRRLANDLSSTVSLLVAQRGEAVALAVVEPQNVRYHITFSEGSAHPLDRGAAGHAISSLQPPAAEDHERVVLARSQGYVMSFGEVEPGAFGLAVPIELGPSGILACVNLISYREDVIVDAVDRMREAARQLADIAR